MYDYSLSSVLDWLTVFGFIAATVFITWQIMLRSKQ